jgi:hypothetical protein
MLLYGGYGGVDKLTPSPVLEGNLFDLRLRHAS